MADRSVPSGFEEVEGVQDRTASSDIPEGFDEYTPPGKQTAKKKERPGAFRSVFPITTLLAEKYAPNLTQTVKENALALPEMSLAMISGGGMGVASGYAGIAGGLYGGLDAGVDAIKQVGSYGGYEPRTVGGKRATAAAQWPFEKLAQGADAVGGWITDKGSGEFNQDIHGAPVLATLANTAINMAPAAFGVRGSRGVKPPPRPPARVIPRETPQGPIAEGAPPHVAQTPAQFTEHARKIATDAGIDWTALPGNVKARIVELSKDATEFKAVTPAELRRIMLAESLPVPVRGLTKGRVSRDERQLRQEVNLAKTESGDVLAQKELSWNDSLLQNFDAFRERTGARTRSVDDPARAAPDATQTGASLAQRKEVNPRWKKQNAAQRKKLNTPKYLDTRTKEGALAMASRKSGENVSALYRKADNSAEGAMPVDPTPVVKWITERNSDSIVAKSINVIKADLKSMGVLEYTKEGQPVIRRPLTMREAETLRQKTNQIGKGVDANGHYMAELRGVIDDMTATGGGDIYVNARAARSRHAMEFENAHAVADLINLKKGTVDRKTALEDVWKKVVLTGSDADLALIQRTLLESPYKEVQVAGKQAMADLAGETVEYLRYSATKGVAPNSRGVPDVNAGALKTAMNNIGPKKLELIFGKETAKKLWDFNEVVADVRTIPTWQGGSTTIPNAAAMLPVLEKILNSSGGQLVGGATRFGGKMVEGMLKGRAERKQVQAAAAPGIKGGTGPSRNDIRAQAELRRSSRNQGQVSLRDLSSKPSKLSPLIPLSSIGLPSVENMRKKRQLGGESMTSY